MSEGRTKICLPGGSTPALLPTHLHHMKIVGQEQRSGEKGSWGTGTLGSAGHCPVSVQEIPWDAGHPAASVGTKL